ncbi:MAG: hypothetical protein HUJ57_07520 [Erysipelotrichaceae bacterium]|nr:hypothetical protein [Erysipelotrichaceae bacterium]
MVNGLEVFRDYFEGYDDQYVLIGGAACDILFRNNDAHFRATRDLDMVLIVEALTPEFVQRLWEFIKDGKYRNKATGNGKPQFYRFDKPENDSYPKMIELFCKADIVLAELNGITPVHVDDSVSSLSAILLDGDYYKVLLEGRTNAGGFSVLRPEYLILFKAKAYLDLRKRKDEGYNIDTNDIRKHKKDVLRIAVELILEDVKGLPLSVNKDINDFVSSLKQDPFDDSLLKGYGVSNEDVISVLNRVFLNVF